MGKQVRFTKRVVVGDRLEADVRGKAPNVGTTRVSQRLDFDFNTTSGLLYLPDDARLFEIVVDVRTAWNSATSDTISVGRPGEGGRYIDAADLQTQGRVYSSSVGARLAAIRGDTFDSSNEYVTFEIASAGGSLSAGVATLEVWYDLGDNDTT